MADSRGWFPDESPDGPPHRVYAHQPPIALPLDHLPASSLAWRRAVAQAGVDIAASFLEARPAELAEVHVAAIIPWPKAEAMEVCVFFDPEGFRRFDQDYEGPYQRWTALGPERSLARELGLVLPPAIA